MSVTQAIAQWTTTTRYADLPPEAVQVVKRMGLDTLGVSLAAVTEPGRQDHRRLHTGGGRLA